MLKEFAGYGEVDVRDPYGGSYYDYLDVRDEILDSIEKIADKIIELKINRKQWHKALIRKQKDKDQCFHFVISFLGNLIR